MANIPEIQLPPSEIIQVGNVSINNAILGTFMVSAIIIIIALITRKKMGIIPNRLQIIFEMLITYFLESMEQAFGSHERAKKFLPLIMTLFIFLLISNQFALIPFLQSIITPEGVELFRTPTSHYSLPISLTILIWILANGLALTISPLRYIGNFIKLEAFLKIKKIRELPMAFLEFFLGLMDIIGELAKLVSLSTRLFGNIFAGEVIITIISGLFFYTQFILPIPFLILSILAGFVQAFVFVTLSIVFLSSSLNSIKKQSI